MSFNKSDIKIIENTLEIPDFNQIQEFINSNNTWNVQTSTADNSNISFLKLDLINQPLFTNTIFDKYIIPNLDKFDKYKNKSWIIDRIYINGQSFGQHGNFHRDRHNVNYDNPKYVSVLLYINDSWNPSFNGTTAFMLNENTKKCFYKQYMPNDMIIFPPNILHLGFAPTRHYNGLRKTLIYHLKL